MNSTDFLGKEVEVRIDRPLGSAHPRWGFRYPVNYGFIPGTRSGDGEEIDAYVLGVGEPLAGFRGVCIAVIRRAEESDDKLVVVPPGTGLTEAEIRRAVDFQERFFKTEVIFHL